MGPVLLTSTAAGIAPDQQHHGKEFATEDKLDPSGLVKQKGKGQPKYSAASPESDVSLLFESLKFGRVKVQNRLVYAPLTRSRAIARAIGNVPQENAIEYYTQRARGSEGGLILTEATVISEDGIG